MWELLVSALHPYFRQTIQAPHGDFVSRLDGVREGTHASVADFVVAKPDNLERCQHPTGYKLKPSKPSSQETEPTKTEQPNPFQTETESIHLPIETEPPSHQNRATETKQPNNRATETEQPKPSNQNRATKTEQPKPIQPNPNPIHFPIPIPPKAKHSNLKQSLSKPPH
jgi:hypothetical protein